MELNDLLRSGGIDPQDVLVLRHSPPELALKRVLPLLAAERPEVFNAYQQTQRETVQKAMQSIIGRGYVASFIARKPHRALFVGLYSVAGGRPLTPDEYWQIPANLELKSYSHTSSQGDWPSPLLWFDLQLTEFCRDWKGRLVVDWPLPERRWWRWADRNRLLVAGILEENALGKEMPDWREIVLTCDELQMLPASWWSDFSNWRVIYYIFDISDRKGYVGSASGAGNLKDRWQNYAATGHGGNALLRKRQPQNLRFSILERVSPDLGSKQVVQLEQTWKLRLHTHAPFGLNEN